MNNLPLRGEDIREKNEKLVLRAIQMSDALSQSEVVNMTGLKAPTVLRIFSILEENGFIRIVNNYTPKAPEKKGRKPVYYHVVENAHHVIGVEFWSRSAHVLITDFSKKPIYSDDIFFPENADADIVMKDIIEMLHTAIRKTGIRSDKILGIGIGAPGRINVETQEVIFYSLIEGFENLPLGKILEDEFNIPVAVTNNAGVIALNAYRRGIAQDCNALFTFFIRQGVGGAFITNGNLFSVSGKTTFEVGHMIVDAEGRECYCGSNGCLETYISETGIMESLQKDGYGFDSIKEVEQALKAGDTDLRNLIKRESYPLAVSAQNLFRILSPDVILVITRFRELSKVLTELITECLQTDSYNPTGSEVAVYADGYSALEAGLGACDLVFDAFFSIA